MIWRKYWWDFRFSILCWDGDNEENALKKMNLSIFKFLSWDGGDLMKIKEKFKIGGLMHGMRFLFDKSAENLDEDIHTDFNYDHLPVSIFSEPIRILSAFWMDA